ncbi:EexN family lipoprotein [Methylomonas paludis]|uniref:EexN family lipoprotein n=1 Tax=Methylomonas paludis TaxID=1173101 RepID=A0A975R898_9GAMM|nr:EexN family lipoprotein [Methylomonas paludis]QWF69722.1 EexN family lipoprotein [Methylomonas paludis]
MKKNTLITIAIILVLGISVFKATIAGESKSEEKSVAWYVANLQAAKAQNKECYGNPGLQSTANCVNSLHALEISFKGGN